jgi:hypothetical protein
MSSVAAGALARKRAEAPQNKSKVEAHPGLKTYVDTLTALVPAEVLALHAAVYAALTKKSGDEVIITDEKWLEFAFYALIVFSVLFYLVGYQKRKFNLWTVLEGFIPPFAFVLWCMSQQTSAVDAAFDLSDGGRQTLVILGTALVTLMAAAVPIAVDKAKALPK